LPLPLKKINRPLKFQAFFSIREKTGKHPLPGITPQNNYLKFKPEVYSILIGKNP
jgi:hypothetical protein